MKRWITLFVYLFICSTAYSQAPDTSITIHGKGTRGPYSLGLRNIVSGSVHLFKNGRALGSDSLSIEYAAGIIWLNSPLSFDDSINATFEYIPLVLKPHYYRHRLASISADTAVSYKAANSHEEQIGGDLKVTGSKGFSIQAGQGVAGGLSQSLNLTIAGDLVPGLKTSAHISDKTSGQSGVTRRFEELDKIFITAESENFRGTFGDFDISQDRDPLLGFQRRLTGLNLDYGKDGNSFAGAAAFFPGEYSSITISGQDGRLGPYYLTDVGGRKGAQILPGSERVYLDGILQRRGSQNDYEIDYDAGAIKFAPSKVIRDETRITIDYEVARQEYSRSFYRAWGETSPQRGFRFYSSLISEGDNRNSPKGFELTPEIRQILSNAGSDRLAASRNGAQYVGTGSGDYTLDTTGGVHYSYVGQGAGDYAVSFSFVGENLGSYLARGAGVYEYAGEHLGDYEPIILIPLPEAKRYGSFGAAWSSEDSLFSLEGEAAGSAYDRNMQSQNDPLRRSGSFFGKGALKRDIFGSQGYLRLEGRARSIGDNAVFPGRIDDVERYRAYDLESNLSPTGEDVQEVTVSGGPDPFRIISFEAGHLTHPGLKARMRYKGGAYWKLIGPLSLTSTVERTHGERTWWKSFGTLTAGFSRWQPSLGLNLEKRDGLSGFKYFEYAGSLPANYSETVSGSTEIVVRDEKYLDKVWLDKFLSASVRQRVVFVFGHTGFSGEAAGSYYRKDYREFSGTNSEQKTGWARLSYSDPRGAGGFSLNEQLGSSNERLQAKNYVFVGDGRGEYRLEDGEYIRDPEGDYVLVIEELGEGQKATEIATEFNGNLSPFRALNQNRVLEKRLGRLNIESHLSYSLKKTSDRLSGDDFVPWRWKGIPGLNFQSGQLEMRAYYYPPRGNHRIRYSQSKSFERGSQYVNESAGGDSRADELSWSFPLTARIDLTSTGQLSKSRRQVSESSYDIDRWGLSFLSNYGFRPQWTLSVGGGIVEAWESENDLRANLPSAEIGLARDFRKSGRMTVRFAYTRMNVNPADASVPFQLAQGKGAGDNFEAIATARMAVTKNGRFDSSYRFESFSHRPEKHNLRLEFTVLFL